MSDVSDPCEHAVAGEWPWHVRLVLDEHLGIADAVVACRHCGQRCLVELLDLEGPLRAMRVSVLAAAEADQVARDLERGSCDVNRARAEVQNLRARARLTRTLLGIDTTGPVLFARMPAPPGPLPHAGWRELPCDGRWVRYLRSNNEITNG